MPFAPPQVFPRPRHEEREAILDLFRWKSLAQHAAVDGKRLSG